VETLSEDIKALENPIPLNIEQYTCEACTKKSYINSEDKISEFVKCCLCGGEAKNTRIFQIEIQGIGEY